MYLKTYKHHFNTESDCSGVRKIRFLAMFGISHIRTVPVCR
jgi:hypothetical protein